MSTFLADGFRSVDSSADTEKLGRCLSAMEDLADFRAYKQKSFEALNLRSDSDVADIACGLGYDLLKLRQLVPDGGVTGFDISEAFVAAARDLAASDESVRVVQGDVHEMAIDDGAFDGARTDRSLQHMEKPDVAVSEMARIVKQGGTVVAAEPDWTSYHLVSDNAEVSAVIEREFGSTIRNPAIGRQLVDLLGKQLQIGHHSVHPILLRHLPDAEIIFDITHSVQRCCDKQLITKDDGRAFLESLSRRSENGTFFALLCVHVVSGIKR
ncbi:methyltransferase domain-containing protein [Hoeflea sp.]|uniref:methyltransferase domain-containing protein n=1 Tax=Hoeflea sp. TaxID=1940281 RepID=UPI003B02D0E3